MYTATLSSSGCSYHRDGVSITKEEFEAALMSMAKTKNLEAKPACQDEKTKRETKD